MDGWKRQWRFGRAAEPGRAGDLIVMSAPEKRLSAPSGSSAPGSALPDESRR